MKKIMILGAGIYQVPLIKVAKKRGIYTIVVSRMGDYPGLELADKVYYIDTTDIENILRIAKKERIDGITTTGTDVAVPAIGRVCDELGLKGISFESAMVSCDKVLMKKAFKSNNVRTAGFFYVNIKANYEEIMQVVEKMGYPVIFKAVDSSGSRGITKVMNENDVIRAWNNVKCNTKHDEFIIEEFIEGEEFGAQAFVQNGRIEFVLPHGDYVFKGDTGVPIGHYAPYECDYVEVCEQLSRAIKAMGLDNCAVNADFMLHDGKVYVLEIGARAGATMLAELVSIYYSVDYYQ